MDNERENSYTVSSKTITLPATLLTIPSLSTLFIRVILLALFSISLCLSLAYLTDRGRERSYIHIPFIIHILRTPSLRWSTYQFGHFSNSPLSKAGYSTTTPLHYVRACKSMVLLVALVMLYDVQLRRPTQKETHSARCWLDERREWKWVWMVCGYEGEKKHANFGSFLVYITCDELRHFYLWIEITLAKLLYKKDGSRKNLWYDANCENKI